MAEYFKKLSMEQIDSSKEIRLWLDQFKTHRSIAIGLLLQLQFISRDVYSEWLKKELLGLIETKTAIYVVRKFKKNINCIWDDNGEVQARPAGSQGSEDLVHSVSANLLKSHSDSILDHPSIKSLRDHKVRKIVLLDDSIGSGTRVASYIRRMMNHKSFLSWWSYGKIQIEVLAFARTIESNGVISKSLFGSNHGIRKYPISTKINILSRFAYKLDNYSQRWGASYKPILELCDSLKHIPPDRRRGYGETMANIVFYHSVPNNLPGLLWYQNDEWNPLFPKRTFPVWLPKLLESKVTHSEYKYKSEYETLTVLRLIKSGIRNVNSIAWQAGLDSKIIKAVLIKLKSLKLISSHNHICEAGRKYLANKKSAQNPKSFDYGLYIPQSWCVDQETVQPLEDVRENGFLQAESGVGPPMTDGEVGKTSLERTDAKTASPSFSAMTQKPSKPRKGHDTHGPLG